MISKISCFPFLGLLLYSVLLPAQNYELTPLTDLSETTRESSGLLYREGRLITHNDSGDTPRLYELDTLDGTVLRSIFVEGATHVDWEDITADETYLYVADFGNNFGTRTDLRIYRISWTDYLNADTVTAAAIDYAYTDQTDFTSNQFFTPYDAESLVALGDTLYVFTKNWSAPRTRVYALPKTPGSYSVSPVDSFEVSVLLTGVDASPTGDRLLFTGYSGTAAKIVMLSGFSPPLFSQGEQTEWGASFTGSSKTEAVAWRDERFAFVSTETSNDQPAALYLLDTDFTSAAVESQPAPELKVFPQPAQEQLSVTGAEVKSLTLYTLNGTLVKHSRSAEMLLDNVTAGSYLLLINTATDSVTRKVVIW